MLRICLVVALAVSAGTVLAQSDDPRAVAPVVYSDAPPADAASCADDAADDACALPAPAVIADDAPVVDESWDYYPGVSLWTADYYAYDPWWVPYGWAYAPYVGFGYGWPYYGYGFGYGYAAFGYGWPAFGFFGYWHDGYWHHHGHWDGWGRSYVRGGGYQGPYQYPGHGRPPYPTQTAAGFAARETARPTLAGARAVTRDQAPQRAIGGAARPGTAFAAPQRLASASYYSAARQMNGARPAALPVSRVGASARPVAPADRAVGARTAYRVTSMPSRGYATSAAGYRSPGATAGRTLSSETPARTAGGYAGRATYSTAAGTRGDYSNRATYSVGAGPRGGYVARAGGGYGGSGGGYGGGAVHSGAPSYAGGGHVSAAHGYGGGAPAGGGHSSGTHAAAPHAR